MYTFLKKELKGYTISDFFPLWVAIPTLTIATLAAFMTYLSQNTAIDLLSVLLPISIQASVAIAAITTAGEIILISGNPDDKFIAFLHRNDLHGSLVMLFLEPILVGILNIFLSLIILIVITMFAMPTILGTILVWIVMFSFAYTLLGILSLYDAFKMYGEERHNYLYPEEKIDSQEKELPK